MTIANVPKTGSGVSGKGDQRVSPVATSSPDVSSVAESATALVPDLAQADQWYLEGNALVSQQRFSEAIACYQRACRDRPDFFEAFLSLGLTFGFLRRYEEAVTAFEDALRLRPNDFGTLVNLGVPLLALERTDEAILCMEAALQLKPDSAELCNNLGTALKAQGKLQEAVAYFIRALQLNPKFVKAYLNMAATLRLNKQPEGAAQCYREAIRLGSDDAETHNSLGLALGSAGRFDQAEASFLRALQHDPNYAAGYTNLGSLYSDLSRYDEALACFRKALTIAPNFAEAHNDIALMLERMRDSDEADKYFEQAVSLKPKYAYAHMNRAMLWLRRGWYDRAWTEYEWRWLCPDAKLPKYTQPAWNGEPLEGRTILLSTEQGYGDTLQFVRYARLLKERGATVLISCGRELAPFLASCSSLDRVVVEDEPLPSFDYYIALMSLPRVFETAVATIPADIPYFKVDPQRSAEWARELGTVDGFRVGINWQGSPKFIHDRRRSIPLKHFAPLAELQGIRLYSLQRERGTEQLAAFREQYEVTDLGSRAAEQNSAYIDRAAMMMNLDLFITSDTGLAHLAGSLGVPTWVALSFSADWRWLEDRDDSPWYPSMRLFRQDRDGNWDEVFARMAKALQQILEEPSLRETALRDLRLRVA